MPNICKKCSYPNPEQLSSCFKCGNDIAADEKEPESAMALQTLGRNAATFSWAYVVIAALFGFTIALLLLYTGRISNPAPNPPPTSAASPPASETKQSDHSSPQSSASQPNAVPDNPGSVTAPATNGSAAPPSIADLRSGLNAVATAFVANSEVYQNYRIDSYTVYKSGPRDATWPESDFVGMVALSNGEIFTPLVYYSHPKGATAAQWTLYKVYDTRR